MGDTLKFSQAGDMFIKFPQFIENPACDYLPKLFCLKVNISGRSNNSAVLLFIKLWFL